eukprot:TRINITY_DN6796_c0_g1_i2.p2 TRINITY_DN6796_c0_g1~~TRINITY_DN6796_c0_g1_i2.p2  ORF type:complete len:115 (+),score=31.77 TRINITY_DN6796_c0_g1_i2:400-744(+)
MQWRVVCAGGAVEVQRGPHEGRFGYLMSVSVPQQPPRLTFFPIAGVEEELKSFAADVCKVEKAKQEGHGNIGAISAAWQGSPSEALRDLAVIEAAIQSGFASSPGSMRAVEKVQ